MFIRRNRSLINNQFHKFHLNHPISSQFTEESAGLDSISHEALGLFEEGAGQGAGPEQVDCL